MCGIAGLLDPGWSGTAQELTELARAMARPLAHRGPAELASPDHQHLAQ